MPPRASDVRGLLSGGMVDVNKAKRRGRTTPLIEAAWKGHSNVVQVLLDEGAEADRADHYEREAIK